MSDYFDQLETGLRGAVRRRAHLPWHARMRAMALRNRGLVALVAALVVATPTVAAVGAVSGWFSQGRPDVYYPASPTSGLGKVLPKGGQLLPIRAADPDGGPPWGVRLVKTTRGETCIQVGRVVRGQIGALGIDGAWKNDHLFHEIKPNNQLADICGATDSAGTGFVNDSVHGAPASVDVPLYNSNGASGMACRSPYEAPPGSFITQHGGTLPPSLERIRKRVSGHQVCPAHAMRMIFAGLLGPEARSITYRTPDGSTRTEKTVGGVGAYLIVFRETVSNCGDFTHGAFGGNSGCQSDGVAGPNGDGGNLQQPTAVTQVAYANGKACDDRPDPGATAAWRRLGQQARHETGKQARARFRAYLAAHNLTQSAFLSRLMGGCKPVGWSAPKGRRLTAADVASPIKLTLSEGKRFCVSSSQVGTFNGAVPCDKHVPSGDRFLYGRGPEQEAVLATISFVARQPVTTANSYYEWAIKSPGNNGGGGGPVQRNIRAGQRVTLSQFVGSNLKGMYRGTVAFVQNSGQTGTAPLMLGARHTGAIVVGHFSFRLPLHH